MQMDQRNGLVQFPGLQKVWITHKVPSKSLIYTAFSFKILTLPCQIKHWEAANYTHTLRCVVVHGEMDIFSILFFGQAIQWDLSQKH